MTLRPAQSSDKELLLEWRNHPETWKHFFDAAPVKQEDHEKWFQNSLVSDKRKIFICCNPDPIGMVRFDFTELGTELSWIVAPEARGKGFGALMLQAAVKQYPGKILAKIMKQNEASIKIALKAGFTLIKEKPDHLLYVFNQ